MDAVLITVDTSLFCTYGTKVRNCYACILIKIMAHPTYDHMFVTLQKYTQCDQKRSAHLFARSVESQPVFYEDARIYIGYILSRIYTLRYRYPLRFKFGRKRNVFKGCSTKEKPTLPLHKILLTLSTRQQEETAAAPTMRLLPYRNIEFFG